MTLSLWLARTRIKIIHWCYVRVGRAQDRAYDWLCRLEDR